MEAKEVLVLMSTYNGEKYIREQIESIIHQSYPCKLVVRDDGSIDTTIQILKEYENKNLLTWYSGNNIGPANSFFDLIKRAGNADYYALADQDDVWDLDKIKIAIMKLEKIDAPKLYFCKRRIVDSQLNVMNVPNTSIRKTTPDVVLLEGGAYGCTMVFDHKTKKMIEKLQINYDGYLHDVFLYRLISMCGTIIYDDNEHINYRQHEANVVGHECTGLKKWIKRFKGLPQKANNHSRSNCAKELYDNYKDVIDADYNELLYNVAFAPECLTCRLKLVFKNKLESQCKTKIYALKIVILLGWI